MNLHLVSKHVVGHPRKDLRAEPEPYQVDDEEKDRRRLAAHLVRDGLLDGGRGRAPRHRRRERHRDPERERESSRGREREKQPEGEPEEDRQETHEDLRIAPSAAREEVAEEAPEIEAGDADDHRVEPHDLPHERPVPSVDAHEELRDPGESPVARERQKPEAEVVADKRPRVRAKVAEEVAGRDRDRLRAASALAAFWLSKRREQQEGERDRRKRHHEEPPLPQMALTHQGEAKRRGLARPADHEASEDGREPASEVDPHGVHRERSREALEGEKIRDDRIGRGGERRLAHADANPGEGEGAEAPAQPEAHGSDGPEDLSHHDEPDPAYAIGEPAEGKPGDGVENRELGPDEEAHLAVAQTRRLPDGADEEREDGPIDEGIDVNAEKKDHPVPGMPRGDLRHSGSLNLAGFRPGSKGERSPRARAGER